MPSFFNPFIFRFGDQIKATVSCEIDIYAYQLKSNLTQHPIYPLKNKSPGISLGRVHLLGVSLRGLWASVWAALPGGCFLLAAHLYRGHLSIPSPAELRKLQGIKPKPKRSSIGCSAIFNLIPHMMQIREIVVVFRSFINKM